MKSSEAIFVHERTLRKLRLESESDPFGPLTKTVH